MCDVVITSSCHDNTIRHCLQLNILRYVSPPPREVQYIILSCKYTSAHGLGLMEWYTDLLTQTFKVVLRTNRNLNEWYTDLFKGELVDCYTTEEKYWN